MQFIALYLYRLVKNEFRKETVSCGSGGSRNVEKEVKKVYLPGNFLIVPCSIIYFIIFLSGC
jgi:hypothetical protein